MQNKLKMVLSSILLPQHPDQATIFQELMTMVHDLRTLNTLHTEKFLQQCKITGQGGALHRSHLPDDHRTARHMSINQHQPMWEIDRESAGNGSPQSSDTHSSSSIDDGGSRRSPLGSVSSTESIGPSEIQKLTAQDLRVNGSVLMNALTAPASSNAAATLITAAGGITISRKRVYSSNEDAIIAAQQQQQQQHQAAVAGALFKARKLDSPIDSGIDSPRGAQGSSHSTNTSVCSSPRSSVEDDNKLAAVKESDDELHRKESPERYEERHPLLKRALQQPPQIYNPGNGAGSSGGSSGPVSNFQDEVYKPHKKFRRNTGGSNNDDCPSSTQAGPASPPPPSAGRPTTNLLASQLAEPPQYLVQQQQQRFQSSSAGGGSSLLASTLSRVTTTISSEECRRNEILANLILEGNPAERFSGLPRCMTSSGSDSYLRQQLQQPSKASPASPGLLMCAAGSPPPPAGSSSAWYQTL
jgi:nuclear receptor subfamily 1 group D member 3